MKPEIALFLSVLGLVLVLIGTKVRGMWWLGVVGLVLSLVMLVVNGYHIVKLL